MSYQVVLAAALLIAPAAPALQVAPSRAPGSPHTPPQPGPPAAAPAAPQEAAPPAGRRPLDAAPDFARQLEAWAPALLERLEVVPALGLAVVVDDRVVLADAWGVADVDTGEPVDADTQFYIASMTKAFTALMATRLHARGALDLDSTLAEHLHGVELDPALLAGDVRLHDLLTHTSGIDNGPIAFRLAYTGQHDPELLWELLAASTPNTSAPLGHFDYTNVGYNILGMIIDRETGSTWQEHLRELVFEPLGMSRTTAYASLGPRRGWTVAAPHFGLAPGGVERLALEKHDDTMQSAGGLVTTPRDMARWLLFQLQHGRLDGEQVVDATLVRATQQQLVDDPGRDDPLFERTGYGLGWWHGSYEGHPAIFHGGGFVGHRSVMAFLPDQRVGVAVMVNDAALGTDVITLVARACLDWWLGAADTLPTEPVDALLAGRDELRERFRAQQAQLAGRTWQLARPRDAYVGRFEHALHGTLEVRDHGDAFEVGLGHLRCTPTPFPAPETMRVELLPGRGTVLAFEPAEGAVERVVLDGAAYTRVQ